MRIEKIISELVNKGFSFTPPLPSEQVIASIEKNSFTSISDLIDFFSITNGTSDFPADIPLNIWPVQKLNQMAFLHGFNEKNDHSGCLWFADFCYHSYAYGIRKLSQHESEIICSVTGSKVANSMSNFLEAALIDPASVYLEI
jgi:hypothetical protein